MTVTSATIDRRDNRNRSEEICRAFAKGPAASNNSNSTANSFEGEGESEESAHFMTQHFRSVQMEVPKGLSLSLSSKSKSNPSQQEQQEEEPDTAPPTEAEPAHNKEGEATSISMDLDWSFLREGHLFGRQELIQALQEAFCKRLPSTTITSDKKKQVKKQAELILISGGSGTGKTQLVKTALQEFVTSREHAGYFLLGKFDQLQAASGPYGAFVTALTQLAVAMEGEGDVELVAALREDILDKVGLESCRALCALVPALGRFLLLQTEPSHQEQEEQRRRSFKYKTQHDAQQDRLKLALTKLFQVICCRKHVVLVADDMQWCDHSSLLLLEDLIVNGNDNASFDGSIVDVNATTTDNDNDIVGSFTVIGACRDNEVPWSHAFAEMLRRLEDEKDTNILHIEVKPLSLEATNDLLSNALKQPPTICLPLAEIIHAKSEGNAFFIVSLLKALHQEGVLMAQQVGPNNNSDSDNTYALGHGHQWLWDDKRWDALVAQKERMDVVDLVSHQIQRLAEPCQRLLKTAACMGAEADCIVLATLLGLESNGVLHLLEIATEEGLMVERLPDQPGRYAFAHDRVQEAAYALTPSAEKPMTHLSLGRSLLQEFSEQQLEDNIFLVVNQLIGGISLLTNEMDKTGLAELCVRAGKKTSQASDFEAAKKYFEIGTSLLPYRHWRDEYHLSLELFSSKAESECCAGDFEEMDETIQAVLTNSRSPNDNTRASLTKIYSLGLRSQFHDAIKISREVLASLGEKIPPKVQLMYLIQEDWKVKWRLRSKTVEEIFEMPYLENREKMAAMSVLNLLPPYVFCAQPEIFPFVSLLMVKLTLKYGICDFSSLAFGYYAVGCMVMNDFENGYKYGKLALRLLERCEGPQSKISPRLIFHVYGVTFHWKRPLKTTFPALRANIPIAMDSGDLECAEIIAYTLAYVEYAAGTSLAVLDKRLKDYVELMSPQSPWLKMLMLKKQMVDNLMGNSSDPSDPTSLNLTCEVDPTCDAQTDFQCYDCWVNTIRLQLGYHFGDIDMALAGGKGSRVGESVAKTSYYITFQLFYDGMTCLEQAHFSNRRKHTAEAKKVIKRMKFLAKQCPENNLHKLYTLEGELCALKGKLEMALNRYNKAIDHATQEGVTQLQALALERASVALQRLGKTPSAQAEAVQYMKRAIAVYDRWGAVAIVTHLEKKLKDIEG